MATPALPLIPDEIERRVAENDTARSTRRAATARKVGELARQHAAIAEQLNDIEQRLGTLLADAVDVVTIDELATFTDIPAAKLTQWRANTNRTAPSGSNRHHADPPHRHALTHLSAIPRSFPDHRPQSGAAP